MPYQLRHSQLQMKEPTRSRCEARRSASPYAPYLAVFISLFIGCQGEIDSGGTPIPPDDPFGPQDDSTPVWEGLGDDAESSTFYAITGVSASRVYLAGEGGKLWLWNGNELVLLGTLYAEDGTAPALNDLMVTSNGSHLELFIAGDAGAIFRYEFDSDAFEIDEVERLETFTESSFKALAGSSADDVWAVGDGGIYHFDGESWARDRSMTGGGLDDVWAMSTDELYAVGANGLLVHRKAQEEGEGYEWETVSLGLGEALHAIWGSGPDSIFIAGQSGLILHYDGSSWNVQESGSFEHLWSLWGEDDTQVFAVGTNGAVLFHDGESWRSLASGSSRNLYGIWGTDISSVYAVGSQATLLFFDNDPPVDQSRTINREMPRWQMLTND